METMKTLLLEIHLVFNEIILDENIFSSFFFSHIKPLQKIKVLLKK